MLAHVSLFEISLVFHLGFSQQQVVSDSLTSGIRVVGLQLGRVCIESLSGKACVPFKCVNGGTSEDHL